MLVERLIILAEEGLQGRDTALHDYLEERGLGHGVELVRLSEETILE